MPSLHVGWAIWCAWAGQRAAPPWVRRLVRLYPATIAFAVVATTNHYAIDVIAGIALALTACALAVKAGNRRRGSLSRSR